MGHAEAQPRRYTVEEYFALEEVSDVRHEFFEGEVFAMAGTSRAHNTIALNMAMALRQGLRTKEYLVQMESVRLAVEENRHYTYPDVLVSCDPHDQRESKQVYSPLLIVEVLSPSTSAYDRGLKFKQYQKLPSLQHYLLIAQNTWRVEWYCRNEANQWVITVLTEPEELLAIAELNLQLTVAEVYEKSGVAPLRVEPSPEAELQDE
ncbi:MAG: Uma2 family endonuclease [Hymenobacter sp.]|nr:MAG: Uma2 family endonuclease [Hymenobacter sp.]